MRRLCTVSQIDRIVYIIAPIALVCALAGCARTSTTVALATFPSQNLEASRIGSFYYAPVGVCHSVGLNMEYVWELLSERLSAKGLVCDSINPDICVIAGVVFDSASGSAHDRLFTYPVQVIDPSSRNHWTGRLYPGVRNNRAVVIYGSSSNFPPPTELHVNLVMAKLVFEGDDTSAVTIWEGTAAGSCTEDNQVSEFQVLLDELLSEFPIAIAPQERVYSWPPGHPEKRKLEKKEMTKVDESN